MSGEVKPADESQRIYGWKSIADEIGVSESRARELANPRRQWPLPVRYGARGLYVLREMLVVWNRHFDAPYGAHQTLASSPESTRKSRARKRRAAEAKRVAAGAPAGTPTQA